MYFINTICTNQNLTLLLENQFRKNLIIINIIFLIKKHQIFIQDDMFESTFPKEKSKVGGEQSLFQANKNFKKIAFRSQKIWTKVIFCDDFSFILSCSAKNIWKLIFSAHTFYITYLDITLHSRYIDPSRHNFENCLPPKFVSQSY